MEYLTYPFHDPSLAIPPSKHNHHPAITDKVNDDDNTLERLRHDPLIRKRSTSNESYESSSDSSSYCSLPLADPAAEDIIDDDGQSHTGTTPSISNLSTTSSQQFVKHHNAAFEKLRTAGFKYNAAAAAAAAGDDSGYTADIPDEWKNYQPPSLNRGHWRTFGPTEAVVTVVEDGGTSTGEHTANTTTGQHSYRNIKRRLEGAKSSLWKGTIWLTETHLIFILLKDEMPERIDPSEIEASSSSHTENWVSSIRRMLGHGHRRNSEDNNVTNDDSFPITADPETGFPITAFQIPLTSLLNIKLKKPHKHHVRSGSTKRNSVASSSTGGWLSPPGSTTISPALSRIQSRNARSLTRHESHLNPNHHQHQRGSRDASPAGNFDTIRGRMPAEGARTPGTPPITTDQQQPALDFGALINNKEDPFMVVVYSESGKNAAKVEFRFESGLYVDEAKDLAGRLKEYVKKK